MLDAAILPGFLTAVVLVTVAPGPDNAYIAAVALDRGVRAGVLSAVGMALGMSVHVVAASLGVAMLLRSAPVALDVVRLLGAVYLAWLAVVTLRAARNPGSSGHRRVPDRQIFRRAMVTNLTNPKVILFFVSFLPQFVRPGFGSPAAQLLTLGALFLIVGLVIDSLVGVGAGKLADALAPGSRAAATLSVVSGLTFATLAAILFVEAMSS